MTPEENEVHPKFQISKDPSDFSLSHESIECYWSCLASYTRAIFQLLSYYEFSQVIDGVQESIEVGDAANGVEIHRSSVEKVFQALFDAAKESDASMLEGIKSCLEQDEQTTRLVLRVAVVDELRSGIEESSCIKEKQVQVIRPNTLLGVRVEGIYYGHYYGDERDNVSSLIDPKLSKLNGNLQDRVLVVAMHLSSLVGILSNIQGELSKNKNPLLGLLTDDFLRLEILIGENPDDLLRIAQANNILCDSINALTLDSEIPNKLRARLCSMEDDLRSVCGGICFEFDSEVSQRSRRSLISEQVEREDESEDEYDPVKLKIINVPESHEWPVFVPAIADFWESTST